MYHAPVEINAAGPVRWINDATSAVSYLENTHIQLLQLGVRRYLSSDLLTALENARPSPSTWNVGTLIIYLLSGKQVDTFFRRRLTSRLLH